MEERNPTYWQKTTDGNWERVVSKEKRHLPRGIFNLKRQLYKNYRMEGKTQLEAYTLAGYEPNKSHASRLEKQLVIEGNLTRELIRAGLDDKTLADKWKELVTKDPTGDITYSEYIRALEIISKLRGHFKDDDGSGGSFNLKVILNAESEGDIAKVQAAEQLQAIQREIPEDKGKKRKDNTVQYDVQSPEKAGDSGKQSNSGRKAGEGNSA